MTTPARLVWIATVAYAAIFFAIGADRYVTFHSGADLGIFAQSIASAFHGFSNTFEGSSHFVFHFSPILYLCAPLVWLTHSALALVFIQAVATALIAPALFEIARKRTSDAGAAALAGIALLYPPLQGVTFTDFHETAFMPAAIAWLLWAIDARRFGIAAVLLAVTLSTKEDQAPAMAFLGAVAAIHFGRRGDRPGVWFGLGAIAAALLVFALYFVVVRSLAGAEHGWVPKHFYAWGTAYEHAPSPQEQILGRLTYLIEAFAPLAFIPLRSRVVLLALPGLAEVLASREPLTYTMGQHYAAVWIPYVLVAFAIAGAHLLSSQRRASANWVRASAALCVIVLVFFSPLHLGHFLRAPSARDAATEAALAAIPRTASVGTYDEIYAHMGFYPNGAVGLKSNPEYVLYDDRYASAYWNAVTLPQIKRGLADGTYAVADDRDGIVTLRRRSTSK